MLYLQMIDLGRVVSMQVKKKPVNVARKGTEVCIRIEPNASASSPMYGRHFDHHDLLISRVRTLIERIPNHFIFDI